MVKIPMDSHSRIKNATWDTFYAIRKIGKGSDSAVIREIVERRYYRIDYSQTNEQLVGFDGEKVKGVIVHHDATIPPQIVKDVMKAVQKGLPQDTETRELLAELCAIYKHLRSPSQKAKSEILIRLRDLLKSNINGANIASF